MCQVLSAMSMWFRNQVSCPQSNENIYFYKFEEFCKVFFLFIDIHMYSLNNYINTYKKK